MIRLLFLDFDGVLHPVSALQVFERRLPCKEAIRTGRLFRWTSLLADVLDGHDDVEIAVHSSWRLLVPDAVLREYLGPLSSRFIGATPRGLSRWPSIEHVVRRVSPASWLALDDHASKFPCPTPPHVLICDPESGVWNIRVRLEVSRWLDRTSPA